MRLIVHNSTGVYNYQDFEALKKLQRDYGDWDAVTFRLYLGREEGHEPWAWYRLVEG